ncbi:DUF4269 domain-containing protein [Cohnella sp. REN36]|nr:DUF4269 domain-containing protein [Cohnella sp. REN36]MCC3374033.1 DUF4269 domain-containing protein [Cohnella sp. REN36]
MTRRRWLERLLAYHPILVGTVPLDLNVPGSDLDLVCELPAEDGGAAFERELLHWFGRMDGFAIAKREVGGLARCKASFVCEGWPVEIFAQPEPTDRQNGYVHMIVEYRLLRLLGEPFKSCVRALKREGVKTEPAFARLLGLEGDPYVAMLGLAERSDEALFALFGRWQEGEIAWTERGGEL